MSDSIENTDKIFKLKAAVKLASVTVKVSVGVFIALIILALNTYANDIASAGVLMLVTADTEIKASPSDTSNTIASVSSGKTVFVTGNAGNGWYIVMYKGGNYYIRADYVTEYDMPGNPNPAVILGKEYKKGTSNVSLNENINEDIDEDVLPAFGADEHIGKDKTLNTDDDSSFIEFDDDMQKALEAEFDEVSADFDLFVAENEALKKENARSAIWIGFIALAAIAILVIGIIASVKNKKSIPAENPDEEKESEKKAPDETFINTPDIEIFDLDELENNIINGFISEACPKEHKLNPLLDTRTYRIQDKKLSVGKGSRMIKQKKLLKMMKNHRIV